MNNEDAISRAAAIEALAFGTVDQYDTLHIYEAQDRIEALPTVPPQVVHGRWIKDKNGVIYCSECGEEHAWLDFRATYCDVCGAKMDGGGDDAKA